MVRAVLEKMPQTRDSDEALISTIWANVLRKRGLDIALITAKELLTIFTVESFLPKTESIRRARQKLQELHPELRGKTYKYRKVEGEAETRGDIREMGGGD